MDHETFLKARRNSEIVSRGNCMIISLTIASSGPLTLLSLSLALAGNTTSTVISALRPSTVNC